MPLIWRSRLWLGAKYIDPERRRLATQQAIYGRRNTVMADPSLSQTSTAIPVAETYSQDANPDFEAQLALRTAAKEGAFFLPYLRPGMRLLDLGCGPGSITLGLAEAVAPGEVVGVDLQPSQVAQAQALSAARGVKNVRFEVADVYRLPFPDGSFDAVFAHVVLMHLSEPVRALVEMRRVLRPGGFAGVRDTDWGGRIHSPMTPLLKQWYDLMIQVRHRNGGDPFVGRRHRELLLEAGFARSQASVSVWSVGTPEETRRRAAFLKATVQGLAPTALAEGWIDQVTVEAVEAEFDLWAERPDAFYVETFCEAIGWVKD
jgi:ubiquinone/menaquinone biosynthesis C-methylase UbiE